MTLSPNLIVTGSEKGINYTCPENPMVLATFLKLGLGNVGHQYDLDMYKWQQYLSLPKTSLPSM